jgi:translocation and assembly module TamB
VNLNLNGTLTDGKNLDFTVVADEIDLAKLQVRLPYPISGKANFTGILKGTTDNPDFDGTLTGDSIVLNGQSLTNVEGRLWFKNNEINLHRFAFAQDGGSFALTGLVNLNTGAIRSSLDVEKGNLANLLTMFDVENRWIDGYLDGSVVVTATYNSEAEDERMIEKPSTHIKGHLDAPRINGAALDSMEIDVLAEGPRITINKMQATADGGALSAAGEINLMEDVDVKVLGEAIPLKLLASMGGISEEASGMANIEASFKGSAKNPSGRMSLDITDGGFGTAVFDTLSCKLSLDNKIINVEKAEVTKDEYKASADGIIPLAAIMKDEGEQATVSEQMDLTVRLDDADLRILPMVSNYVEWAYGATEGKLHLTGTAANPLINGKLHLTDGMMKFQGLANPIQNMILDLDFKDDKIILNDMSGTIGAGSYKMAGTARLDGRSLGEYDFTLDAVKLDIVNKYYKGPFNGTFRLKNEGDTPSLSGSMDFADCVVDVPMLPDDDEPLPEVLLDIDVNIGSRVRLLNAQLCDVFFAGNIHAGGSTVAPDMSGEIHALRGKIYYLKTPFTVREAKAVFSQNNTFLPNITLFADTKMDRTKIIVAVTGPLDDMSFKLMSNPPMSQEQIIAALTLRSSFDRTKSDDIGTDELTDMLSIGLQMSFLNELENMVRNNIGVDEFNIVRDTISESGTSDKREVFNIEIGKYVSDRLLLRYTTGLNYSTSKVGAQYDFNTRYSLNGSVGDGKTLMLESRIKF